MGDKEAHYTMTKGLILQKGITILKGYEPNDRASKYVRQKLIQLKREIGKYTIIAGNDNVLLVSN